MAHLVMTLFLRKLSSRNSCIPTNHVSAIPVVNLRMLISLLDFTNPQDPTDKSFEPHPINFPYVELEYPNTNSREIFPLLIPKDEDHYSPVKEVKKSLFTIIESEPVALFLFWNIVIDVI